LDGRKPVITQSLCTTYNHTELVITYQTTVTHHFKGPTTVSCLTSRSQSSMCLMCCFPWFNISWLRSLTTFYIWNFDTSACMRFHCSVDGTLCIWTLAWPPLCSSGLSVVHCTQISKTDMLLICSRQHGCLWIFSFFFSWKWLL
jgi:hypothetical protein